MPDVKTEGQHREEFLLTDLGDLSRESADLASGQDVADGTLMKFSTGKLVAATGTVDTEGNPTEDIAGFIIGSWDVSADTPVAYVARLASVKSAKIVIGGSNDADIIAWLAAERMIVVR